jgi:hypothetical protein
MAKKQSRWIGGVRLSEGGQRTASSKATRRTQIQHATRHLAGPGKLAMENDSRGDDLDDIEQSLILGGFPWAVAGDAQDLSRRACHRLAALKSMLRVRSNELRSISP